MFGTIARALALVASAASLLTGSVDATQLNAHSLPIFFFHGITGNAQNGYFLQQNLSTDARPLVPLSFCQGTCSFTDLRTQTQLAINQIRSIVANDTRFANGYSFVAHSQGSVIARSVIEEWDDHKVHTFISLAGASNGIFYGPQASDFLPTKLFMAAFAPAILNPALLNISEYTDADIISGRLAVDMTKLQITHPELQNAGSAFQLNRSPLRKSWLQYSKFLPALNNINPLGNVTDLLNQWRRKCNFLKLKEAHFFGSSYDETISPWQSSILGRYNEVASIEELQANFSKLKIVSMKDTEEYRYDTYGLQTLDRRGDLNLYAIDNVSHGCWLGDQVPFGRTEKCIWQPVFEKSVYPLLKPLTK